MTYAKQLDRKTYELILEYEQYGEKGVITKPRRSFVPRENDVRSRQSIESFLQVLDNADRLECIADEEQTLGSFRVKLIDVHTERSATLFLTYSGKEYAAKVFLGEKDQLSVKNGADSAAKSLLNYLKGNEKKTRRRAVSAGVFEAEEDKYGHFEKRFY